DIRLRPIVQPLEVLTGDEEFLRVSVVICALGTTIKKAGSREEFQRIDHDLPEMVFRMCRAAGAHHAMLVSSMGVSPTSTVFYAKVKAALEASVVALGFPQVTIVRPSLLLGDRKEFRLGERLGAFFMRSLSAIVPRRYRAVESNRVAAYLAAKVNAADQGIHIAENEALLGTPL
nr:oxidoreductase [Candidatus Kapabacteria bacterium]